MSGHPFTHLHLHTQYSLLDGACRLDELISQAGEFGMTSLAITDHGNLYGAVKFFQKAIRNQLRPIIGCEVYVAPGSRFDQDTKGSGGKHPYSHLILLCENDVGYRNLSQLSTKAFLEGFCYKPRVDKELLREHHEGIIALSACLGGEIPQKLRQGLQEDALRTALEYREIFGEESFFLELQDHGLDEQRLVNDGLLEIHRETGIPIVATNDVHFLKKDDFEAHNILLCIQTKTTREERAQSGKLTYTKEHYFKSPAEMWERFGQHPDALENTEKIARRCSFIFDQNAKHYPRFAVPEDETINSYFEKVAQEGFDRRLSEGLLNRPGAHAKEEYRERFDTEIVLIRKMDLAGYFLVVWDFIRYALDQGIPVGPGRGSAAGSFVSYCMGITDIDPLKYDLLFERFLNPERISMPDIDIDFCMRGRAQVIEYVRDKYHTENVAQIITFGELKARSAIRDVGRALGVPLAEVDKVAKLVPEDAGGMTLDKAMGASPGLSKRYREDEQIREVVDIARRLEGLTRHASVHAAGVVIAPRPIPEFCPLQNQKGGSGKEDVITTQYSKDEIESLGLLKMDFLGLKTLTIIADTLEIIRRSEGTPPEVRKLPLDDKATFDLFGRGDTDGVFQFESGGMKDILRQVRPKRFEDLIVLNALYRPGPLDAGMIKEYIARARDQKGSEAPVPEVEDILKETLGIIVYQEQVMRIAQRLAGFTLGQADTLRKAMAKKDEGAMRVQRKLFLEGCEKRKMDPEKAGTLFESMSTFGRYGFNKSHSAAYSLLAYQTAYLKAHHPAAFMAATLSVLHENTDEVMKYMNTCREMDIPLLPPNVNRSGEGFTIEDGSIRYGLCAIKNVGLASVRGILEARTREGSFRDLFHFCEEVDRSQMNKRVVENLVQSGAMDCFKQDRWNLMASLESAVSSGSRKQEDQARGQVGLFGGLEDEESAAPVVYAKGEPWPDLERFRREKESLGVYLSGHPLMELQPILRRYATHTLLDLKVLPDNTDVIVGGMVCETRQRKSRKKKEMYTIMTLEDLEARVEVLLFSTAFKKYNEQIVVDAPVLVGGKLRQEEKGEKIIASSVVPLKRADDELQTRADGILLKIPTSLCEDGWLRDLESRLRDHQGEVPVYLDVTLDESLKVARMMLGSAYWVTPSKQLLGSVEEILGRGRVQYLFPTPSGGNGPGTWHE